VDSPFAPTLAALSGWDPSELPAQSPSLAGAGAGKFPPPLLPLGLRRKFTLRRPTRRH
jgi:hypothetical protein